MRRVVITGIGLVTPLAGNREASWSRLVEGRSGAQKIDKFDTDDLPCKIAAQVPWTSGRGGGEGDPDAFDPETVGSAKERRRLSEFIIYGMGAAAEAIADSGWTPQTDEEKNRTGVLIGSGIGGLPEIAETTLTMEAGGPRKVSPFFIPSALINLCSGQVSIKYGFKGPNHSVVTACATGAHAIGDSARLIQHGDADVMVAGGAEGALCRLAVAGFAAAKALTTSYNDEPEKASRPYDKGRDGFLFGEGAGVLILEEYEHAKARGAKIYAEVLGYGLSGDAHHITAPADDGDGGYRAMEMALNHAGLKPEDIDYVNTHGTSTPLGDEIEVRAIERLFGDAVKGLSLSSTKSSIGHLLGAAGAVEGAFTALAISNKMIPPTLNLEDPSFESEIDLTPLKAKARDIKYALSNSFGFGGTNAALVLGRVDD
ncbi:MAG: beta-ketoacyl-[acyl-carrier-protein] synthase II [Ponticaulis sp.]|nr:beta-ketoacyl-[acyl-carrier-protein] synthase II [Ponticaulis sp.]